jgi:hypothetical protein
MMSQQKVRILDKTYGSDLESYHKHRRYQENYAEKVHP